MDGSGMPLNAEWHPDLRFDMMTTLPIVLEFNAFLGDEGSATPDEPHPTDQQFQPLRTLARNLQDIYAFLGDEANNNARAAAALPPLDGPRPPNQQLQPTQRLVHVFDNFIDPILRVEGAYFTHPVMNSLHMPYILLDLTTGDVALHYVKYFQPMRQELLNYWIHDTTTDAHIREYKAHVGIDIQHENNYSQAMSIWKNGVAVFLSAGENHNHLPNLDPEITPWRVFNNGYRQLHRREENGTNWSAEAIFHYCTEDGLPDETKPHVVAFVADEAPLVEGIPSTSAVQAAVWLAGTAAARDVARNHNIFPVTVVCCSGHKVCIAQVVINLLHGAVQIRLSQIVDLRDGDWTTFLHFLSWFLPDPIGDTAAPY